MPEKYDIITIYTSEVQKYKGKPVVNAIIEYIAGLKSAARCIVTKGIAGCYENGEIATTRLEILSYNLPVKIEIIIPPSEINYIMTEIENIVKDGIIAIGELAVLSHSIEQRLIPHNVKVKEAMTKNPVTVDEDTYVSDVIKLLFNSDFNSVPVIDENNKPIGIITQGDLINRAGMPIRLGFLSELESEQVDKLVASMTLKTAGEIMTKPVITATEESLLDEIVNNMLAKKLKRMPVVDSNERIVGMLARIDIFRTISNTVPVSTEIVKQGIDISNVKYVKDIMRRDTYTVKPDTPIHNVMEIIDRNDLQRVAVVSDTGKLLGIVSDRNVFSWFVINKTILRDILSGKITFSEFLKRRKDNKIISNKNTAKDIMLTDLITVNESTPIEKAIEIMTDQGIKRLPVVDSEGIFKGMLSRDSPSKS